jgi:transposase
MEASIVARNRKEKPTVIEVDVNEIEEIIASTESGPLSPEQREKLLATVRLLFEQVRSGKSSRKDSEKLERVLKALAKGKDAAGDTPKEKDKKPGHGRNGASKFAGAKTVEVKHPELNRGDKCPACSPEKPGKVYPTNKPNVVIRLVGMAPIQATVYKMEVLRCNLCGQTFTAPAPEGIGEKKYDETVVSMLAVLKYGSGMPRNRLAGLQGRLGIPLPQPTQWELLKKGADDLKALLKELLRQAAQGDVLHNDDTSMKILKIERPEEDTRTGIFTRACGHSGV